MAVWNRKPVENRCQISFPMNSRRAEGRGRRGFCGKTAANWDVPADRMTGPCLTYDLRNGDELAVGHTVFAVTIRAEARDEAATEDEPVCAGV